MTVAERLVSIYELNPLILSAAFLAMYSTGMGE